VELQERFAPGADDQRTGALTGSRRPCSRNGFGEFGRGRKSPSANAIGPDEVRIAKSTYGRRAILLASGPEVAAREATENRRATRVRSFALKGVEDFSDGVVHAVTASRYRIGSRMPLALNPLSRSKQESQAPQASPVGEGS